MKTPLQELIDYMNGEGSTVVPFVDEKILIKATELLEKERENMCAFADDYQRNCFQKSAEQYYNETFNQNKYEKAN